MSDSEKSANTEERMAEFEAKLALAEDQLDALNLGAYRQQQHIDRLERDLRILRDQIEALAVASGPGIPRDELPPHY